MTDTESTAGKNGTIPGWRGTSKEYAQALMLALEAEREEWTEPHYTAHKCLINLVLNLIYELEEKERDNASTL